MAHSSTTLRDLLTSAMAVAQEYWDYSAPPTPPPGQHFALNPAPVARVLAALTESAGQEPLLQRLTQFRGGEGRYRLKETKERGEIHSAREWLIQNTKKLGEVAEELKALRTADTSLLAENIILSGLLDGARRELRMSTASSEASPPRVADHIQLACGKRALTLLGHPEPPDTTQNPNPASCDETELHDLYHRLVVRRAELAPNMGWDKPKGADVTYLSILISELATVPHPHDPVTANLIRFALATLFTDVILNLKAENVRYMAMRVADLPQAKADLLLMRVANSHHVQAAAEAMGGWWNAFAGQPPARHA